MSRMQTFCPNYVEPDTTTDTTKSPEVTTKCDRDALLALADEMEQIADGNRLTGMMSIVRARSWADRIREALGVTVDGRL